MRFSRSGADGDVEMASLNALNCGKDFAGSIFLRRGSRGRRVRGLVSGMRRYSHTSERLPSIQWCCDGTMARSCHSVDSDPVGVRFPPPLAARYSALEEAFYALEVSAGVAPHVCTIPRSSARSPHHEYTSNANFFIVPTPSGMWQHYLPILAHQKRCGLSRGEVVASGFGRAAASAKTTGSGGGAADHTASRRVFAPCARHLSSGLLYGPVADHGIFITLLTAAMEMFQSAAPAIALSASARMHGHAFHAQDFQPFSATSVDRRLIEFSVPSGAQV